MRFRLVAGSAVVAILIPALWVAFETNDEPRAATAIENPIAKADQRAALRGTATPRGAASLSPLPPRDPGGRRSRSRTLSAARPGRATQAYAEPSAQDVSHDIAAPPRDARSLAIVSPDVIDHAPATEAPEATAAAEERPQSTSIAGSVLERSGAPAAGLQVTLKVRRLFAPRGAAAPGEQKTVTNERGAFAFGALPDGEYELRTEKNERYESASALVRAGTESTVLVVDADSGASVSVHGVIESTAGGPVQGVRIEVVGQASLNTLSDARGGYALRVPASARLQRGALRFRHSRYREQRLSIADGMALSDYEVVANVRLEPASAGVSVTGVVTSPDGTPVPRALVQLDSAAQGRGYRAITDQAGHFAIGSVDASADYRLWVRPQASFKDRVIERVIVDAGVQPLHIELEPIGVATLTGRMVTPEGAPLGGFTLFLTTAYGATARGITVTGDAQGRFVVDNLPEGPVTLQTRGAPLVSVSGIRLSAAAPADIVVPLDVGVHRLEGRVLTREGAPAAGAQLSLEWSTSSAGVTSRSTRQTMANADGAFVFTALGAGTHTLTAAVEGAGSVRLQHAVGSGLQPLQITLSGTR
jgi:hypothetical protein